MVVLCGILLILVEVLHQPQSAAATSAQFHDYSSIS